MVRLQAPEHQEGEQEQDNEVDRGKQAVKQPKGPTGAVLEFFEDITDSEDEGEFDPREVQDIDREEEQEGLRMGEQETHRLLNNILGRLGQPAAGGQTLEQALTAIQGHIGAGVGANMRDLLTGIHDRQQGQSTRALMPEYFYGYSTEDPRQFADKFETYVHLQNIPADRQLDAVRMLLKGPAEVWWSSVPAADKANWAAFRVAFLNAYAGDNAQWMLEQQLDDRKQGKNESVELYINDVLKLAKRLNKDDNHIRQVLVRGLQPEVKSYVIGQNPQGLQQTLEKIKLGETAVKVSQPTSTSLSSVDITTLLEGVGKMLQKGDSKKTAELASALTRVKDDVTSIERDVQSLRGPTNGRQHRSPVCFYCHRPGHFKRDCWDFQNRTRIICQNCGCEVHDVWNDSQRGVNDSSNAFNGSQQQFGAGNGGGQGGSMEGFQDEEN